MKKTYIELELDVISLAAEDVITTSPTNVYDPNGMIGNPKNETWEW